MPNDYFCTSLQDIYNSSAFDSSYFCVTFSHETNYKSRALSDIRSGPKVRKIYKIWTAWKTGIFLPKRWTFKTLKMKLKFLGVQSSPVRNSILLRSGLNLAWLFWVSTRFSYFLKMKSVENILGYIRGNLWNCSRKYPKCSKLISILGNKNWV